jgi:hypothetical protein
MTWFMQTCSINTPSVFGIYTGKLNVSESAFNSDRYNKYADAEPHQGYADLLDITKLKPAKWFLYHEGLDDVYTKAGKY